MAKLMMLAGGVVKAINAKAFAGITIGQADELTDVAKLHGAKGLAFIKIENGEWKSPVVKFFSETERTALQSKLHIEEGDCVFFAADKWETACEVLGRIRLRVSEIQNWIANRRGQSGSDWDFLWVTDFPLFEWSAEENKWNAMHHPFTRPKTEDMPLFETKKFPDIRAEAYDVVERASGRSGLSHARQRALWRPRGEMTASLVQLRDVQADRVFPMDHGLLDVLAGLQAWLAQTLRVCDLYVNCASGAQTWNAGSAPATSVH